MKTNLTKLFQILITIFFISFFMAYMICGFFSDKGQTAIAHGTGIITMCGCFIVGISYLKNLRRHIVFKLLGVVGNFGMGIAYALYLFDAISPSNFSILSHAASSMVYDVTTLILSLNSLQALIIVKTDDKNG